jgi:hypothetical protein
MTKRILISIILSITLCSVYSARMSGSEEVSASKLTGLLPDVENWEKSDDSQSYYPENLFEYINGAAEIYLAYEFKELLVAQFDHENSEASISIEIYDMGEQKNSFGIYSVERYPDNQFVPVGIQGYTEEGILNFLIGDYYIKVFCFGCSGDSSDALMDFSKDIADKVENKGSLPPLLGVFPREGKIENSEKFILRNFLGYGFLHNGYLVNYKTYDLEFDCFLIEGRNEEDAEQMLNQYLQSNSNVQENPDAGKVIKIEDRYYKNIFLLRLDKYICGVMKIKDGSEELGEKYLEDMSKNLNELI